MNVVTAGVPGEDSVLNLNGPEKEMDLKNIDYKALFLSLDGRVNRETYLLGFVVPCIVIYFILSMIVPALAALFSLLTIWPGIVMATKRLHDRGKSGWFQLLLLIPLVGLIWWLVDVCILPGQPGENEYGPEPVPGEIGVAVRAA
ncbi:MAG: DUF805 domain-containing protein [Alphaproteobacteria bacterium]|nr:DUF805 domain-containing protein [Alphaproteobacteria bacterium]